MMVFTLLRLLLSERRLSRIALGALLFSYLDELSQLIHTDWLDKVRLTTLGHLVLGQGFQTEDIVAYTLGILVVYLLAKWLEKRPHNLNTSQAKATS